MRVTFLNYWTLLLYKIKEEICYKNYFHWNSLLKQMIVWVSKFVNLHSTFYVQNIEHKHLTFTRGNFPQWDLQRFAAEDEGRTEAPTDRKLREERDKGNVPKSNDLTGATVLLGSVLMLFLTGSLMLNGIMEVLHKFLGGDFGELPVFTIANLYGLFFDLSYSIAKIVGPLMAAVMFFAIIGNVSQFGLLFTLRSIELKPERIAPDWKRVLPVRRNIMNLLKIFMQVGIIGTAAYFVISYDYLPMLKASNMELNQAITLFAWTALKLFATTAIILMALAIPDYFYQRFEYMENLKMQISEIKREHREEEGDPILKQRQRERGHELRNRSNMLQEVPGADVVITNPTHFAVALKYDLNLNAAPIVSAKGTDNLAFTIRNIAKKNNIHIEENPPLARTLYAEVEIGEEIPATLFKTLGVIFAKLHQMRKNQSQIEEQAKRQTAGIN